MNSNGGEKKTGDLFRHIKVLIGRTSSLRSRFTPSRPPPHSPSGGWYLECSCQGGCIRICCTRVLKVAASASVVPGCSRWLHQHLLYQGAQGGCLGICCTRVLKVAASASVVPGCSRWLPRHLLYQGAQGGCLGICCTRVLKVAAVTGCPGQLYTSPSCKARCLYGREHARTDIQNLVRRCDRAGRCDQVRGPAADRRQTDREEVC